MSISGSNNRNLESANDLHDFYIRLSPYIPFANGSVFVGVDDRVNYFPNASSISPLSSEYDENSPSFRLISDEDFFNLKVMYPPTFDYTKCQAMREVIIDYYLYGFQAKALENVDIAPSLVYGIESSQFAVTSIGGSIHEAQDYYTQKGCAIGDNSEFLKIKKFILGSELNGVVDSDCINNVILPGHTDATSSTTMPPVPTKCDDPNVEFKRYLQGYKWFSPETYGIEDTKWALTHLGVVYANIKYEYYIESGESSQYRKAEYDGYFLGWDEDEWIIAKLTDDTFEIQYAPMDKPFGASSGHSQVLSTGNSRALIKYDYPTFDCVSVDIDTHPNLCPCPDKKTDKAKWEADPRTKKIDICASGSMRAGLSVVVVAVVLPVLALFW